LFCELGFNSSPFSSTKTNPSTVSFTITSLISESISLPVFVNLSLVNKISSNPYCFALCTVTTNSLYADVFFTLFKKLFNLTTSSCPGFKTGSPLARITCPFSSSSYIEGEVVSLKITSKLILEDFSHSFSFVSSLGIISVSVSTSSCSS
jgi:hypothetical protein